MTALLIDNVPLLAAAPNGIQKLRELILDLAVRGKLVPQDPNDEPASELLDLLLRETSSATGRGKGKKQALLRISESEQPFVLPEGWTWVRLGDVTEVLDSFRKPVTKRDRKPGPYPYYGASGVVDYVSAYIFDEPLVLVGEDGAKWGAGERTAFSISGKAWVNNHAHVLRPKRSVILDDYLVISLVAQDLSQFITGMTVPKLNQARLVSVGISLPPIAEQHRIVAKVDELMALCDRLEARQADAESAHAQLVQALLESLAHAHDTEDFAQSWQRVAEHFHALLTTESSIDALKQTLLQLAVTGKLVPQDPNDESAIPLLRRNGIEAKPHTLHGWANTRLGQLGEVLGGSTPSKANSQFWGGNIPWVSPKDMKRPVIHDSEDHVSPEALEGTSLKAVPANSLLMVVRGMILAHSFPVALTAREVTINQDMKALVPPKEISRYLLMYLQAAKLVMVGLVDRSSHGTCKLISEKLWAHTVSLPPLAEQHRIVAKVDQLMALCDQLKARLSQARQVHEQLASALVEQAVA
ncbi:MAG TPA: restriction endonuclease subunit S [Luteimonas sp.]